LRPWWYGGSTVIRSIRGGGQVGRVDVWVDEQGQAGYVGGEEVVCSVVVNAAEHWRRLGHAAGWRIRPSIRLANLQVRVAEGGITQTESELVHRLNT